jgi:RNA polymerase sigma-70 factor, ECF subfamily
MRGEGALAAPTPTAIDEERATTVAREQAEGVTGARESDAALVGRVANGDGAAFEELYRRFARAAFGLALRRLPDRASAEHATREAFATVWRSSATYPPEQASAARWLFAVARDAVCGRARRTPAPSRTPPDPSRPAAAADEKSAADWRAWSVHRALAGLAEEERVVVELAYFSGLAQGEITAFLDVPPGTVEARARAALAHLADALEGELR